MLIIFPMTDPACFLCLLSECFVIGVLQLSKRYLCSFQKPLDISQIFLFKSTACPILPNKLPEDRMACAFVYLYEGALCVSNGHKLPFFCRRLPWCAMEVTGTLRDG